MKTEHILVVKREKLFSDDKAFQGLNPQTESLLEIIDAHKEFHPRNLMEEDFSYKQIIPYLVFKHEEKYFLMQRKETSSEQRLKNKYSLGIGGHMRHEDLLNGATIFDWAEREFNEEIEYTGTTTFTALGILNDDSTPVGQVHLGLVLLLEGDSSHIKIRSELKSGQLLTALEIQNFYSDLETWSQIIFDELLRPLAQPPVTIPQKQSCC